MKQPTDYTGLVSAKKTDKSDLFEIYYGQHKSAPLIKESKGLDEGELMGKYKR